MIVNSSSAESVKTISQVSIDFTIKPYEIDAAGHVNNAVYHHWLEDLRVKLFDQFLPLNVLLANNCYPAVASTEISYKHPLFLGDNPCGKIKIDQFSRGIWYLNFQIENDGKTYAAAKQKCVIIDLTTNKMLTASELRNKFSVQL